SATNWPLLSRLGIGEAFAEMAGPSVRETAIFVGKKQYRAALPRPTASAPWGRALAREHLDTLLVERAAKLGAVLFQPARCGKLEATNEHDLATIECRSPAAASQIAARVVIAAHGAGEC